MKKTTIILVSVALTVYLVLVGFGLFYQTKKQMPTRIMVIGAPGSGKGTVGEKLSRYYDVPMVTVSSVVRDTLARDDHPEAKALLQQMNDGVLLDDKVVWRYLEKALTSNKYKRGYILDGYPRTLAQAKMLAEHHWTFNQIIELEASDQYIAKRLEGRRVHLPSGRSYNLYHNPPRIDGRDDVTGEKLVKRPDDDKTIVMRRLSAYRQVSLPMLNWLHAAKNKGLVAKSFISVDAQQPLDRLWEELHKQLASGLALGLSSGDES